MPSIVSPVKQNVPVRWRPFRPTAVVNDACTSARGGFCPLPFGKFAGNGFARNIRSIESIVQVAEKVLHFFQFNSQLILCVVWCYGVQNHTVYDFTANTEIIGLPSYYQSCKHNNLNSLIFCFGCTFLIFSQIVYYFSIFVKFRIFRTILFCVTCHSISSKIWFCWWKKKQSTNYIFVSWPSWRIKKIRRIICQTISETINQLWKI